MRKLRIIFGEIFLVSLYVVYANRRLTLNRTRIETGRETLRIMSAILSLFYVMHCQLFNNIVETSSFIGK
jgi:hypothetical protein